LVLGSWGGMAAVGLSDAVYVVEQSDAVFCGVYGAAVVVAELDGEFFDRDAECEGQMDQFDVDREAADMGSAE